MFPSNPSLRPRGSSGSSAYSSSGSNSFTVILELQHRPSLFSTGLCSLSHPVSLSLPSCSISVTFPTLSIPTLSSSWTLSPRKPSSATTLAATLCMQCYSCFQNGSVVGQEESHLETCSDSPLAVPFHSMSCSRLFRRLSFKGERFTSSLPANSILTKPSSLGPIAGLKPPLDSSAIHPCSATLTGSTSLPLFNTVAWPHLSASAFESN